ncbi:MAG: hypothetical protein M0Z31_02260 [Clostridia bacterium]|nr:hypothetical protein [Clostridia bacterium]
MPDQTGARIVYGALMVEKDQGFALFSGLQPFGSIQITVDGSKGKLIHQVGNLQPSSQTRNSGQYHLWLVASGGEKPSALHVDKLSLDLYGQGRLEWEFEADNVADTGRSIVEYDQVVITFNLEGQDFHLAHKIPLLGHLLQFKEKMKAKSDPSSYMPQMPPWLGSGPFGPTMFNHNWMCPPMPPWLIPQQTWWLNSESSPHLHDLLQTFPPQMVGVKLHDEGGVQYLVHGILGRFCKQDWPDQGTTGYRHWHPLPGYKYQPDHWGYWLLYIDPITGQKANPLGDTVPPG